MKYKFILILFLLPLVHVSAQTEIIPQVLEECEKEGMSFGDGTLAGTELRPICSTQFRLITPVNTKDIDSTRTFLAFGYKSIIFYRKNLKGAWREFKITGSNSLLQSVEALKIDEKNENIVVIANGNESIYTYTTSDLMSGNVSPTFQNVSPMTEGATNLDIDNVSEQIAVVFSKLSKIRFFNRMACKLGLVEKKKLNVLGEISGSKTLLKSPTDIAISIDSNQIFVLDGNRILVYARTARGDVAPIKILSALGTTSPQKIKYLTDKKKIIVYDSESNKYEVTH